ncbi:MAG: SRPBCC family protein [Candidatus Gracilibacteria bacterium]|jgi:uncharacterized protein YndB with AHSA1/START domain
MEKISIQVHIKAPLEKVWEHYTKPESITKWNFASDDWHCPKAECDLRPGGIFSSRMEAKDGSFGFDFSGTFDEVKTNELLTYSLGDARKVEVHFEAEGAGTIVTVLFDPESENSLELQRNGWQAILNNFKKFTEQLQ